MAKFVQRGTLVLALGLIVLSGALPALAQSTPTFATTSLSQSGIKQANIGGYLGVQVNYTSHLSSPLLAFVYLNLVNPSGQTVYVGIGSCNLTPSQSSQCFVALSPSLPAATYTAHVFAVTTDNVPVSTTGTLQVVA